MAATRKSDFWWMFLFAFLLAGLGLLVFVAINAILNNSWTATDAQFLGLGLLCVLLPAGAYAIVTGGQNHVNHEVLDLLRSINDRLLVSEIAKEARSRETDRNALRQAVKDEIQRKDFEAALVLVEQLSKSFGYVREAEEFRDEIVQARHHEMGSRVSEALQGLEKLINLHSWEPAAREANKIQRLFPDSERSKGLLQRVRDKRDEYKMDLERKFLEAAGRDDVETAWELFKEMDGYLTEAEAEPLRETARGVVGKKRQNLGVQFKLAVQDKEWTLAVRVGEQIVREFPNTKMADEVRVLLDRMRANAAAEQQARRPSEGAAPRPQGLPA